MIAVQLAVKAGICRSGRPLVCGEPDAPETIAQVAQSVGATLLQLGEAFTAERQAEQWSFRGCHHHWQDLPFPVLPWQNAVTALAVLEQMRLATEQQIRRGLLQARLSGRMQLWQAQPRVLLDVAHNPILQPIWPASCSNSHAVVAVWPWWVCCEIKTLRTPWLR